MQTVWEEKWLAQKSSVYLRPRYPPWLQEARAGPLVSLLEPTTAVSLYFQQETLNHVYFHRFWINDRIFPISFSGAGSFGTANTVIRTNAVDLSNPAANVSNLANSTNTTNNAMLFRQTLVQGTPKDMMFLVVLVSFFFKCFSFRAFFSFQLCLSPRVWWVSPYYEVPENQRKEALFLWQNTQKQLISCFCSTFETPVGQENASLLSTLPVYRN